MTVLTFLFSDVADSTGLLRAVGEREYAALLDHQAQLLEREANENGGRLIDRQGDGCFFVFDRASGAVLAAAAAQRELTDAKLQVRIGIHTGEATTIGDRFVGIAVHRAARICAAALGGETMLSPTTRQIAADALPPEIGLVEAGAAELEGVGVGRLFRLELAEAVPAPVPERAPETRPTDVRVGDADRERVASLLREHVVEGRLTLEEYGARLDDAYTATSERGLVAALRELPDRPQAPVPRKRRAWLVTLLGSVQRRGRWSVPRRIFAFSLLGAPDFDFRQASVGDEVKITSISLMGALTAIVPVGVEVELGGLALIGGNDLYGAGDRLPAAGPRIRIRSYALFGGARVTCLPAEGDEQRELTAGD